ncbi:MAG: hypothetical protein HDR29_05555 [Lachnospiraceae bacterium]|nr:hypothetical protein [Lachnospiraceae bacterium]
MNRLEKEAYELQEKDIEQYLNEALPELNIRLWADMYGEEIEDRKIMDADISLFVDVISNANNILWLESITFTSYTPRDALRNIQSNIQNNTPINTLHHNKWRIINRLMGKLALKLPFTLKKYRKERR